MLAWRAGRRSTVKTRLINSGKGLVDGAQFIMAKEGLGGFYKGVSATIAKSANNQVIRFIVFNQYKNVMSARAVRGS
jgi:hypothetical protein